MTAINFKSIPEIETKSIIAKKSYINPFNLSKPKEGFLFIDFIENTVSKKAKRRGFSYVSQYNSVIKHLNDFSEINNCDLYTNSITEDFIDDFILFLESINLKQNTIKGILEKIKAMARKAGQYGYIIDSSFDEVSMHEEETYSVFLSMNDITRIYYYKFVKQDIRRAKEHIRDLFVVGCLTALRYSDYSTLNSSNFQDGYIIKKTKKTNITVQIPMHDYIKEIIEKYNGSIPGGYNIQYFNRYIKIIAKEIGFTDMCSFSFTKGGIVQTVSKPEYELISSHTARRSAATNMYLTGRMKTYEIMKITGHTTEKNFFRYIKVTGEDTARRISSDSFFKK